MLIDLLMWSLLIAVSVSDLKEHRIPNKLVLMLVALSVFAMLSGQLSVYDSLKGGAALFTGSLVLYLIGAMAAGDVKLLGAVGLFSGWQDLGVLIYYILIAGGVIAVFYLALDVANRPSRYKLSNISPSNLILLTNKHSRQTVKYKPLRMPFGPTVVIGMALANYYS